MEFKNMRIKDIHCIIKYVPTIKKWTAYNRRDHILGIHLKGSNAIHDFGDSISILISYILEKISLKKPNSKYTYGYLRYSLVGALVSSLILFLGAFIIIYKSIPLLFKFHQVNSNAMLVLAIFGTIFNGIAAIKTSKGHSKNEKIIRMFYPKIA